jgi:LPPG:FO 2-phospho-L-lactate transferase
MLETYGAPTWFKLGDRDLATHLIRTDALRNGARLTEVEARLAAALGVRAKLLPMTDEPIRTKVRSAEGWLDFQEYFVRRRHADPVLELRFDGMRSAAMTSEVAAAIGSAELVVIAPSNPFVSIGPILAVPGVRAAIHSAAAPVVAISPIVGGAAVRGPAADMLVLLGGKPATASGLAAYYARTYPDLIDLFVLDKGDAAESEAVAATGLRPLVTDTLIGSADARRRLAEHLSGLARPT